MKVEELRLLIKEVVRETMQEELRQILTEAVQIASNPNPTSAPVQRLHFEEPAWVKELKVADTPSQPIQEVRKGPKSPLDLLKETAKGMTSADLSNFS